MTPSVVWFRQDLRLRDNPALDAALRRGGPLVPVYVMDEEGEGRWAPGAASRWWLHHSLASLDASLRELGSRLVILRGASPGELCRVAASTGARAVYWNRRYEPHARELDARVSAALQGEGIEAVVTAGTLLFEPESVANRQGGPFQVFTPFWRHCLERAVEPSLPGQRGAPAPQRWPHSLGLGDLGLLPRIRWDLGIGAAWRPGEASALKRLAGFVSGSLDAYDERRDLPGCDGTSMLSPALHFGELSPRQIWDAVRRRSRDSGVFPPSNGARVFLSEVGWREFAHHLLHHFPRTTERPLRPEFERFPWARDPDGRLFDAWKRGRTGYPIVDAGMRQLWETGWMHNRVRMIAASFLVKHLRLPWQKGADWFWNTLVDADLANNTLGWQWTAGCGADAAPYFRIFAPVKQGERFDPQGAYVRRWVPELAGVSPDYIHAPWLAPEPVLEACGVRLGSTYPKPIVDHASARDAALAAFQSLRSPGSA